MELQMDPYKFYIFVALGLFSLTSCATKSSSNHSADISIWDNPSNPILFPEELEAKKKGELPKFDIPVVRNASVEMWLNYFQGRGRKWFNIWLERSGRYIPMMRQIIREHGLPEDLVYLAMIESGFSAQAYSRAAAVGHWQFMRATGRMYGLKVNFWLDERRDPEKATVAAARHLKDLYDRFKDWKLAAAAYNAGAGKVSRAIRRYSTEDFWEISKGRYLARETRNYVPKLIAAALIAKNPEAYGFSNVRYQAPLTFEEVIVAKPVDLKVLARKAGTKYEEIQRLNPELNFHVTPPYEKNYRLRVPSNTSQAFVVAYSQLGPDDFFKYAQHRIQRGETISTIASRYGISQREIIRMNKIRNTRAIQIGQNLILPVPEGADFKPQRRRYRQASRPKPVAPGEAYHVKSGDSLWSIANAHNISIRSLKSANNLYRNKIKAGQTLRIPGGSKQAAARAKPKINASMAVSASPKSFHIVRRGESLWTISKKYGVSIRELKEANQLRKTSLSIGQRLDIPGEGRDSLGKGQSEIFHIVRRGETLWSISQRYGQSIQEIKRANNMRRNTIHPGKKIRIPSSDA